MTKVCWFGEIYSLREPSRWRNSWFLFSCWSFLSSISCLSCLR